MRLLQCEMTITSTVIAMPVINIFFGVDLGLNQFQIGLSQAAFTVAVLLLNIPAGIIADRVSRKYCNVGGDLLVALGFIFYANVTNFGQLIAAEVVIGVGAAFSQGADVALLRGYAQKLGISYRAESARVSAVSPWFQAGCVLIGGAIGAWSPRFAVLISAVPYLVGALLSFGIDDTSERAQRNQVALRVVWRAVRRPQLGWSILAMATASEITHAVIWVFSPLLLLAGVAPVLVGAGWALNFLAMSLGGYIAGRRWALRLPDWASFVLPAALLLFASVFLVTNLSLATVWLYAAFGFARGWYAAVLAPIVQHYTPDAMQATVFSVAASIRQLLYVPLVIVINGAGNDAPQWSIAANSLIFAPLILVVAYRLWRLRAE